MPDAASRLEKEMEDPDNWDEPKRRPKSERRQRGAMVSVRLSSAELKVVQERAEAEGKSLGAFMRDCALASQTRNHVAGMWDQQSQAVTTAYPTVLKQGQTSYTSAKSGIHILASPTEEMVG